MAGYVTKSGNYIYDSYAAGENLKNGQLVKVDENNEFVTATTGDVGFRIEEHTEIGGVAAVVASVVMGNHEGNEVYFVENAWDVNEGAAYDEAEYEVKSGQLCRAHKLVAGDWVISTMATGFALEEQVGVILCVEDGLMGARPE